MARSGLRTDAMSGEKDPRQPGLTRRKLAAGFIAITALVSSVALVAHLVAMVFQRFHGNGITLRANVKYLGHMVTIDAPRVDFDAAQPVVRPYSSDDFRWALELLEETGGRYRVRRGQAIDVAVLPGLIAECDGQARALLTLARHREELELVVVAARPFEDDIVGLLIDAAKTYAGPMCRRVYTICSNAELEAQRSLQMYGFRLATCRPGNIEAVARRADVPVSATLFGLPMRDELEFDQLLP